MSAFWITTVKASGSDWVAVTPPVNCNGFTLRNTSGSDVLIASDPNDPDASDTLGPQMELTVPANIPWFSHGKSYLMYSDTPAFYVKGTQGGAQQVLKATWTI